MIRTESEYREASARLRAEADRLREHRARLQAMGLSAAELKRAMDPMESFHQQLAEEVQAYERLRRGDFEALRNFNGLGRLLIGVRIALGITQRELAERLQVSESQVSRDERNEYHGVTVERVQRILDALDVKIQTKVELPDRRKPAA